MTTPNVPKAPEVAATNGGPPFGPYERDAEYAAAQKDYLAKKAADDAARGAYLSAEHVKRTSTDRVAKARAAARMEELQLTWLETHAAMQQAEQDREKVRQNVIKRRTLVYNNEYAKVLNPLRDALKVAAEKNAVVAALWQQAETDGVKLDVYFWPELQPGTGAVYTKMQAWTDALNRHGWFRIDP